MLLILIYEKLIGPIYEPVPKRGHNVQTEIGNSVHVILEINWYFRLPSNKCVDHGHNHFRNIQYINGLTLKLNKNI